MLNKIIKLFSILVILSFLLVPVAGLADEAVDIHFFWSKTCPHCAKEEIFLDQLEQEYGDRINIHRYEVTASKENSDLFIEYIECASATTSGISLDVSSL